MTVSKIWIIRFYILCFNTINIKRSVFPDLPCFSIFHLKTPQGSRCSMNVVKESPVLVALLPSQTSPSGGHSRYRHLPHVFWDMTSSWHHHHQPSLWRHNTWEERERGTLAKCYYRRDIKRLERSFVLTFVCISLNFVMLKPAIIYCGWHMYFFCRTGFVWWSA